jgi:hypothetical protein
MKNRFQQGYYKPKNPNKFVGDITKLIYKSSYERKYMIYCDMDPNTLRWGYEAHRIPYYNPVDKKVHTYIVDFWTEEKNEENKVIKYLIEVKPDKRLYQPVLNEKRKTAKSINYHNEEKFEYIKNFSKWKYAAAYAKKNGMEFRVVTEKSKYFVKIK